jgi:repressor LexA
MNLTPKQLRVYEFIKTFRDEHGYAPTLEEISEKFGVSKITVLQHLRALEKRGAIRRSRYQARSIEILEPAHGRRGKVPLVGAIAAGRPIEAIEDRELFDITELVEGKADPFVLRVQGDSMIDEQIRDGDYVICERRTAAHNGETVVAVVEDGEATLKKFYRERGGRVRLEPANAAMKPLYPKQIEIRGVVIGVLRKY